VEHPVVLQLGGSEARALEEAPAGVARWGYDAINLIAAAPSDGCSRAGSAPA